MKKYLVVLSLSLGLSVNLVSADALKNSLTNMLNEKDTTPSMVDLSTLNNSCFFPNPCGDILKLRVKVDPSSSIYAFNFKGQVVRIFKASEDTLQTDDLKDGLYLFTGIDIEGNAFSTKIMKSLEN